LPTDSILAATDKIEFAISGITIRSQPHLLNIIRITHDMQCPHCGKKNVAAADNKKYRKHVKLCARWAAQHDATLAAHAAESARRDAAAAALKSHNKILEAERDLMRDERDHLRMVQNRLGGAHANITDQVKQLQDQLSQCEEQLRRRTEELSQYQSEPEMRQHQSEPEMYNSWCSCMITWSHLVTTRAHFDRLINFIMNGVHGDTTVVEILKSPSHAEYGIFRSLIHKVIGILQNNSNAEVRGGIDDLRHAIALHIGPSLLA
jgi:hypothetical protein